VTRLRTLIVDDEAPARERLRRLLAGLEEVQVIGEARDGLQAVELIGSQRPDLVLLDIQMPGLDGFSVLQALDEPPAIIFVTAYDEYAIRAFEVNATDYLLKPISRDRLKRALARVREEQAQETAVGVAAERFTTQFAPLLENLASQGRYLGRLAVCDRHNFRVLDVDQVDWIETQEGQVRVHVGDTTYPIRRTLAELEARLDPERFFRAHRSAIVNLDRVKEIVPWFQGTHKLRLTTGAEVELSRARGRELRRVLRW
jgi:two-component system LytT family response regulator